MQERHQPVNTGSATASRPAVFSRFLNRRAGDAAKRAENTAIALVRAQHYGAILAIIEKLAGIGGHRFGFLMAAFGACQLGL
jgi:hypothetical protein